MKKSGNQDLVDLSGNLTGFPWKILTEIIAEKFNQRRSFIVSFGPRTLEDPLEDPLEDLALVWND